MKGEIFLDKNLNVEINKFFCLGNLLNLLFIDELK